MIFYIRKEDAKSIARAGCNLGLPMPEEVVDWIYWKLGKKIAEEYMLPYNQKIVRILRCRIIEF